MPSQPPAAETTAPAPAGPEVTALAPSPEAEVSVRGIFRVIKWGREKIAERLKSDSEFIMGTKTLQGIGQAVIKHIDTLEERDVLSRAQDPGFETRKVLYDELRISRSGKGLKYVPKLGEYVKPKTRRERRQEKKLTQPIHGINRGRLNFFWGVHDVQGADSLYPQTIATRRANDVREKLDHRTWATDKVKARERKRLRGLYRNGQISRAEYVKGKQETEHSHYLMIPNDPDTLHPQRVRSKHTRKTEGKFLERLTSARQKSEEAIRKAKSKAQKAQDLQAKAGAMPAKAAKRKALYDKGLNMAKTAVVKTGHGTKAGVSAAARGTGHLANKTFEGLNRANANINEWRNNRKLKKQQKKADKIAKKAAKP